MTEVATLMAEQDAQRTQPTDLLILAAALVASAVLVWLASGEPLVAAGYGAGVLAFAALGRILLRPRSVGGTAEFAQPDWSVTNAAIDRPDAAVAITDRAGRLVCANRLFEEWFGMSSAPPRLPLDDAAVERLDRAARAAWRDGEASADGLEGAGRRWTAHARRSGRGEDYLAWTIEPVESTDIVADAARAVAGKAGLALGQAGICAAVVSPDGAILSANPGFALAATGEAQATVVGTDFVSYLRSDEQDRIYFAREGRKGAPQRLIHLPVADPESRTDADPALTPSLMLLIESGTGAGEGRAGIPQIEALLARLPLGLAMCDRDGRFLFANEAFLRAAGHDGTVAPPYPSDLVIRDDKGALADAVRRIAQGAPTAGDVAVRLRSAPEDPVSLSVAGVRGLGEGAVLLSLKDSSEEARLKRQIAQATKMQAVGQLAGGVAHDFNNVLTAIIGYCDLMLLRHSPGDSDYDDIVQIKANSNRAASLTRQLLAFSRQQTLRPQVLQLPDLVSEVSQLLKRLIGEKIKLVVSHDRDLGPIRADPTQIENVIINLAVNARDAMQGKSGEASGTLRLATRRITPADVRALKSEILPAGNYTALVIEDTGSGIPPENLGKIFEPFFTTKELGKGTGLGLSTVYGIVKQSGGFIFADSEVGKGTRFTVYLPVYSGTEVAAPPVAAPAQAQQTWSGGGRVLLVEDEDTVRAVAERALVRQGYVVTTAGDGEAGLEAIVSGGTFDLVLSDVVMPTMDGPTMARAIRERLPSIPVLFMSGYAEEQLRREIDLPNMHFLPKPFSVAQIGEAVERVLKGQSL
ncbi:response regulator [Novosphingobium tardum]|uniref:histidine kinase n=1 Tax=Novosphingobium tardum TaxID=1538021 RepID=A0ABV8RTY8_9SPHN